MRSVFIFSLFVFTVSQPCAQLKPYNKAIIWRGFQHQWTYNHRCNRIGDFVQYNHGRPRATHTSATGIGPDSTYYTSYYTFISSPYINFKEGKVSLKIAGKEKELLEGTVPVSFRCDEWLQCMTNYTTFINGFDLRSEQGSDKIQLLRIALEDAAFDSIQGTLQFNVRFSIVMNCQSFECPEFKNIVNYDLDVYYLIAGMNDEGAEATEQFLTRSYSWDRKEELNELPEEKMLYGDNDAGFQYAAVGIKAFSVILNEAHWMLGFSNNLSLRSYDASKGRMKVTVNLAFKEWQVGMKGTEAARKKSRFAEKRKGWAALDMDAVLLQCKQASIIHHQNSGTMFWKTRTDKGLKLNSKSVYEIPDE